MNIPILYMFPMCPYCIRVMNFAKNNNIELELRDIQKNNIFRQELIEISGITQVPYLMDEKKWISMPESADIIDYLKKYYL